VQVHYRGTLLDGTEFDSSYLRDEPVTFQLNGVIPGWTEGLQLMQTGARYKFYLPPRLGYGERGAGGQIGPNAALIFEVELLSIGDGPQ
jgi:FKBP-type peptidyl-prolyl cis-trans isomerase